MSTLLSPLTFPLHGSRLIEASAGTGKTWTIAALYLRLVLGHGGDDAFERALLPSEILVMTFTRAATRELSNRVRERLVAAASAFRGQSESTDSSTDSYLDALMLAYPDACARPDGGRRNRLRQSSTRFKDALDVSAKVILNGVGKQRVLHIQ